MSHEAKCKKKKPSNLSPFIACLVCKVPFCTEVHVASALLWAQVSGLYTTAFSVLRAVHYILLSSPGFTPQPSQFSGLYTTAFSVLRDLHYRLLSSPGFTPQLSLFSGLYTTAFSVLRALHHSFLCLSLIHI